MVVKIRGWKDIWNEKIGNRTTQLTNSYLLKLNGYDSCSAKITTKDWKKYTDFFIKKYKITSSNSILDIGCGSGAFLLPFYKKKINCTGIDYSNSLIKVCNKIMPKAKFYNTEAKNIKKLKKNKYDFIFLASVLQYFPSSDYFKKVINGIKLLSDNNTKIFILDIPDKKKFKNWKKYVVNNIGLRGYMMQYSALKHHSYNKARLKNILKKEKFNVKIYDQKLLKKPNSKFRFNIFMEKNEN
ncbi:class I SAM-dependent methyltransferase [Candidatus Pelagibacter sp.]|nr:class I SAM-dependent methyltransferase [Candidatus Pelagibacter sp.]